MSVQENSFRQFWSEVGNSFLYASLKSIILLVPAIFVASLVLVVFACVHSSDIGNDANCSILMSPKELFLFTVHALPHLFKIIFAGAPPILLGVLYLEWDRYKKDEAPHLGGYWGWTVPNRPWSRSNFERLVTGQAWAGHPNLSFKALDAHSAQVTGTWSDAEILRIIQGVSRRYTSLLRKPRRQTPDGIEWHFLINGGDELTIAFERTTPNTSNWRLTVQLYEWAGRRQPLRLAQTHTTEFVLQANGEAKPSI